MLRQGTYSSARFILYDYIKSIATKGKEGPTPVLVLAGCAGAAGGLAGIIGNPFEVKFISSLMM